MTASAAASDDGRRGSGSVGRVRRFGTLGLIGLGLALLVGYGITARTGEAPGRLAEGPAMVGAGPTQAPTAFATATEETQAKPVSSEVRQAIDSTVR